MPVIDRYLDDQWMEKGLSENTLMSYRRDLTQFSEWLQREHQLPLLEISDSQLLSYLGWRIDQGLSARSTARFLSCIRGFYRYQLREGVVDSDPSLDIDSPKLGRP
jgi:integrase/recombinase XerD